MKISSTALLFWAALCTSTSAAADITNPVRKSGSPTTRLLRKGGARGDHRKEEGRLGLEFGRGAGQHDEDDDKLVLLKEDDAFDMERFLIEAGSMSMSMSMPAPTPSPTPPSTGSDPTTAPTSSPVMSETATNAPTPSPTDDLNAGTTELCALEAQVSCFALLPTGEQIDCDALRTLRPSDLESGASSYSDVSNCEGTVEYDYSVRNKGAVDAVVESLVRTYADGSTQDLIATGPSRDWTAPAGGDSLTVSEFVLVNLCDAESIGSSVKAIAETVDFDERCEGSDSYEVVMACGVGLEVECNVDGMPDGGCENIQQRLEDAGGEDSSCEVDLVYTYTVTNTGEVVANGVTLSRMFEGEFQDLSSFIPTNNALIPGQEVVVTEKVKFDACEANGDPWLVADVYATSPASRTCSDEVV